MIKPKRMLQAIKALNNSENIGDFALLKADALGAKANRAIANKMQAVKGYYPQIELAQLAQLPQGTFGYEYAKFMQQNKLQAINISPELTNIANNNVFAVRYAITHDIFHVLLGFDTSYAGEMGVLAFAVEQKYSNSQTISFWAAQLLYPILAPRQTKAIFANKHRGKALAKKAVFLLNYRFEDCWAEPLVLVREKLGIDFEGIS